MDGQTIRQSSVSNRYGTTKVFESQNLTDKQIHNYAQQLAGDTPLKEVRPGIYTAKLNNGNIDHVAEFIVVPRTNRRQMDY